MIKRTIEISSEGYSLALKHGQLDIRREKVGIAQIPIEDIGVLIVDTPQAVYTHGALMRLIEEGGVAVLCGEDHQPVTMMLPIAGHHLHSERLRAQVEATIPNQKQAWKQIIQAKLRHQAIVVEDQAAATRLRAMAAKVKSGDPMNVEAQGARTYWRAWLGPNSGFRRDRNGDSPNNLLNYGYMALRAACARAICGTGLHPALALRHSNRYNPFGLADDLMEPLRPVVDRAVRRIFVEGAREIDRESKKILLSLFTETTITGDTRGPLLISLERYAYSLYELLAGKTKKLMIPTLLEEDSPVEPENESAIETDRPAKDEAT